LLLFKAAISAGVIKHLTIGPKFNRKLVNRKRKDTLKRELSVKDEIG